MVHMDGDRFDNITQLLVARCSRRATFKFLASSAAGGLVLTVIGGHYGPTAWAQEATPEAVAPPQSLLPATWDEAKGQTAHVNGIDLYYEVYGAGEPLVLLHGGLANGTYF